MTMRKQRKRATAAQEVRTALQSPSYVDGLPAGLGWANLSPAGTYQPPPDGAAPYPKSRGVCIAVFQLLQDGFAILLNFVLAVFLEAYSMLRWNLHHTLVKPFAGLLLCLGLFRGSSSFLPVFCHVPGVSIYNSYCVSAVAVNMTSYEPSNTLFIKTNNELFANMVDQASPLKDLPYEMTYTELAIRDVRTKVDLSSSLSISDQEKMLHELDTYIYFSGDTMNKLQTFTANILDTIDRVLINTEWTALQLNRLEAMHSSQSFVASSALWMKSAFGFRPDKMISDEISMQLEQHIDNIEPDLAMLIIEAQMLLINFEALQQPLENMKMMAAVGTRRTVNEQAQFQAQLWSWGRLWARVGGEPEAMGAFGRQLDMLLKVDQVVNDGSHILANTLVGLRSIDAQIKSLRDSFKRSRNKAIPDRKDLLEIALGAERLSKLQFDERRRFMELSQGVRSRNYLRIGDVEVDG